MSKAKISNLLTVGAATSLAAACASTDEGASCMAEVDELRAQQAAFADSRVAEIREQSRRAPEAPETIEMVSRFATEVEGWENRIRPAIRNCPEAAREYMNERNQGPILQINSEADEVSGK